MFHLAFSQDFFVPTPAFVKWFISKYSSDLVIEAGAGRGLFSSKLLGKMDIRAFDIATREEQFEHVIACIDCTSFPFSDKCVVVVARPNHGSFVDDLFKNCFNHNVKELLYIGLEKNFDLDIDPDLYHFEIIQEDIGEDHEKLLRITKNDDCKNH